MFKEFVKSGEAGQEGRKSGREKELAEKGVGKSNLKEKDKIRQF